MARKGWLMVLVSAILVSQFALLASPALSGEAPRISKEVLKALLDNPEVTVIDVRRGKDYDGSGEKVSGAVRESEKNISWATKYPKEKILVLYCA